MLFKSYKYQQAPTRVLQQSRVSRQTQFDTADGFGLNALVHAGTEQLCLSGLQQL